MPIYKIDGSEVACGGGGSPISGKRILMIGDSNMQYSGETIKDYMESTYGCSFTVLAKAGITWEYTGDESSAENVTTPSGVGYTNEIIAQAGGNIISSWDYIVYMLGSNCVNPGTLSDTAANFDTMCGAMRYCLQKLCYYARAIRLGIVVPIRWNDGYTPGPNTGAMPERIQHIEEIARQFSVPTLNMWNRGRIIPDNFTPSGKTYYLQDDKHMGGNGTTQFERTIGKWLAYEL